MQVIKYGLKLKCIMMAATKCLYVEREITVVVIWSPEREKDER